MTFSRAGLVLLCLASLPTAQAYVHYLGASGQPQKWNLTNPPGMVHTNVVNRVTRAVRYFLGAEAYSSGNRTAELDAARACFDQWQSIPGTILRFEEGGLVGGNPDVNTADNTNLIYWIKNTTLVNGGFDNIMGATGVTFADYFTDGTLAEVDIVLNGNRYQWFTDFTNSVNQAQFVESILLHEIGHFVGLAHSPVGGSTMFPRGAGGVNLQSGLSHDEVAAVQALYPQAALPATLASLSGRVTIDGQAVLGAVVVLEDPAGNVACGTLTRADGQYGMTGLLPGNYSVRITPMDPIGVPYALFRGSEVQPEPIYVPSETEFLPTANTPVKLTAGQAATQNFTLSRGSTGYRVGRLRPPTASEAVRVLVDTPVSVSPGQAGLFTGVYSADLPEAGAVLRITGDGLSFGGTQLITDVIPGLNPPIHLLSIAIDVSPDATPGLRSFVVEQGGRTTYANGFLEIAPPFPDFNFDGLDDRFQRRFFPRWTGPDAAPTANPDGDSFDNAAEYLAGTSPVDGSSVLRVESVRLDATGATVSWPSEPGKRYQLFGRPRIDSIRGWQKVGTPVTATGLRTEVLDPAPVAQQAQQFYRVQAVP